MLEFKVLLVNNSLLQFLVYILDIKQIQLPVNESCIGSFPVFIF